MKTKAKLIASKSVTKSVTENSGFQKSLKKQATIGVFGIMQN